MAHSRRMTRKADDRGRIAIGNEFGGEKVEVTIHQAINTDDLPVMRAVHFMGVSDENKARLFAGDGRQDADALFGVHWLSGPVWSRSYYSNHPRTSALKDFNAMNKAADGALVSAYYGAREESRDGKGEFHLNDYLKVGICPPGSNVRAIRVRDNRGKTAFVKCLPLIETLQLARDDYPELFEGNVKGLSIYETKDKEERIRSVYEAHI